MSLTNKVQLGCLGLSDNSQLMVNWLVWGPVFWDSRRTPTQQSLAEGGSQEFKLPTPKPTLNHYSWYTKLVLYPNNKIKIQLPGKKILPCLCVKKIWESTCSSMQGFRGDCLLKSLLNHREKLRASSSGGHLKPNHHIFTNAQGIDLQCHARQRSWRYLLSYLGPSNKVMVFKNCDIFLEWDMMMNYIYILYIIIYIYVQYS